MLRALITAFATSQATTRAERFADGIGYGIVSFAAVTISIVFISMATYFRLSESLGSGQAAAIVAAGFAVAAVLVAVYARWHDSDVKKDIYDQLGLSALGISSDKDLGAIADQARGQIRRVGPIGVALAALAAGVLLGRRI